jgi:hypothetical protein
MVKEDDTTNRQKQPTNGGDIMAKVQDYIETDQEREEGHADTRNKNHECEKPDPALGCDLGIDVQG